MSEFDIALAQIEADLLAGFNIQDVNSQLQSAGVSEDFLSSAQSFGAYVEVDLLDYLSPATAVRLGSVNATAVVVFDRDLSDHRFYFTLEGAAGPTVSLPLPGRAATGVLAYTSTFDDYAGPFVGVQASAGSAVSLAIDVNPEGGFDKAIAVGYSSSLTVQVTGSWTWDLTGSTEAFSDIIQSSGFVNGSNSSAFPVQIVAGTNIITGLLPADNSNFDDLLNNNFAASDTYNISMQLLLDSPDGKVSITYVHPDGYLITQTMQRLDNHPGYTVNVFESITDLEGNSVPRGIAVNYIAGRVWRFEVSEDEISNIESFGECFGAKTLIDMWPLDAPLKPDLGGVYDQDTVRAKIWKKPIELIEVGDTVVSFDDKGNMVPGYVPRTFQNEVKNLLNFFGTRVTPGHVYYRADSKKAHKFETLIDILRDDGVIKHQDGTLIRAAINVPVGDPLDGFVKAVTGAHTADGTVSQKDQGRIRLGTRFTIGEGEQQKSWAVADLIAHAGGIVGDDEMIRISDGSPMAYHWEFGDTLPKPEDFVLECSGTTLEDIYKAAEWEGQQPQLPAPMIMDGGPVQPLSHAALNAMPRNEPLDLAQTPVAGPQQSLNRKQRKAMEAKQKKASKAKRFVH